MFLQTNRLVKYCPRVFVRHLSKIHCLLQHGSLVGPQSERMLFSADNACITVRQRLSDDEYGATCSPRLDNARALLAAESKGMGNSV